MFEETSPLALVEGLNEVSLRVEQRKKLVKFDTSGTKMAVLACEVRSKNKRYQFSHGAMTPLYTQLLSVYDLSSTNLENEKISPTFEENTLLHQFYSEKMVREVEFLGEGDEDLCLVFDNEILCLKIFGTKMESYRRIALCSSLGIDSAYCGLYKNSFIFNRILRKGGEGGGVIRLESAEYFHKDHLTRTIEMADSMIKTELERKRNRIFESSEGNFWSLNRLAWFRDNEDSL